MITKFSIRKIGLLFAVSIFCTPSLAEPSNHLRPQDSASRWQWMEEKWNGDEAAYQKLRAVIEKNKREGKLTSDVIERYRLLHEKKQTDPSALYQWSYASFEATQTNPPIFQAQLVSPTTFEEAPSPHTYEYDRLRFLVWAHYSPHARFQSIGERLLRHTPNDNDVRYYLIQCYEPEHSEQEKQKALTLAQNLIHSAPYRPGAYSALAGIYFRLWMVNHQTKDGNKAVSAYQEYLYIAPKNYAWRRQAASIIGYIRSHQAAGA